LIPIEIPGSWREPFSLLLMVLVVRISINKLILIIVKVGF